MVGDLGWVRRFCLMTQTTDDRLLDTIVGTSGRFVAAELVAQHRDELAARSDGLTELIESWCAGRPTFDTSWDTAFGLAEFALATGGGTFDAALRIACRLTETGFPGNWEASLPTPLRLRLGDLLLPDVEQLTVVCAGATARVRCVGQAGEVECVRDDAAQWTSSTARQVPAVGISRSVHLLDSDTVPSTGDEPLLEHAQPVDTVEDCMVERFQESLEVLAGCGYQGWVDDILRSIIVTAKEPNTHIINGSISSLTGMIHISFPASVMDIAEALVHECAHQYFHLVNRVGPYTDGSDPNLYWSPPMRQERPLEAILVAYHALANVRLFYRAAEDAGVDGCGYVRRHDALMARWVATLDEPLRSNATLTDLGRALYEPLAQEIAAKAT